MWWYLLQDGINLQATPFKITSLTKDRVSLLNPQTAADLLAASGEVYIQKASRAGEALWSEAFLPTDFLYSVDGVRMNTAIFRAGNLQNVIFSIPLPWNELKYCSALALWFMAVTPLEGSCHLQPYTGALSNGDKANIKGNAAVRYSSANNEKPATSILAWAGKNLPSSPASVPMITVISKWVVKDLMNTWEMFILNTSMVRDSIFTNADPKVQVPSGYTQYNLMQKNSGMPLRINSISQYAFHHSATSEYSRYDRLIRYRNGLPRSGEWNYGPQIWTMHNLSFSLKSDNGIYDEAVARVAYQYFEESRLSRDLNKKKTGLCKQRR